MFKHMYLFTMATHMYIPPHSIHEVVVNEEERSESSGYPEMVLLPC